LRFDVAAHLIGYAVFPADLPREPFKVYAPLDVVAFNAFVDPTLNFVAFAIIHS